MTLENLKKQYKHLKELIDGKVQTDNPIRNALIISDATENLKELLRKFPELEKKESKKEIKVKKEEVNNSKEK